MNIIVCVKQVPNTKEVKTDPVRGTLIREGVPSILNPDDANALEAALAIKDQYAGTHITVLTMGPPQAEIMLRECLAMGADKAILLSDRAFSGADTWATSNTLAHAIRKIGAYDMIFTGRQAIDGDTAQVGPQIAERLGLSQVTYVQEIKLNGDNLTVLRQMEEGCEIIELQIPALLTAVKELNRPRYMTVGGIIDAYKNEISVWSLKDLNISDKEVGINASPTQVLKTFTPPPKGKCLMLEGPPKEKAKALLAGLREKHII
ncbi:MAG: electron transfer flavoprotein subunit beta [Bacillota bacterium]|jgi:electron transfer flavoprotein alpha/beta subunit